MAWYMPTGKEMRHAHTSQMHGYYCFCVCAIVKSSLRATNNGNFLQSSGGRLWATVCAPLIWWNVYGRNKTWMLLLYRNPLESSVMLRILMLSEKWITESAFLTEVRPDMVFNCWDARKRKTSDLVVNVVKTVVNVVKTVVNVVSVVVNISRLISSVSMRRSVSC